ncbi:DNA helicase RecQ [Commensalibacter papalotli (ex Botero et al. 2024)]|uniref:DNA helicase RecQ n=1 Tax=Commensalibacter papalotli (ex Botero et al. 2024) TaxID=2972766 RepID=A0ABM9HJB8_9PROT|nr:DNA helicase RecQ [Commensalibacter papalotli (ex Botero et al. 2024)]CAI3925880.1 Superfamily II DNA helicase RecQ (RecQ) (PDB:1OYW) [Commensalibacter papalotli (ex Botero et al. 2024)]CAI3926183.1 Superfamily II DNA helicase RecQ (RecQ) (PDB:1OYW) [Commensalibacter papalotli (ex Botero et al. 2024)]
MILPSLLNDEDSIRKGITPQGVLEHVFGYEHFRGLQQQAIDFVMQGQDVLLLMPTGGGKSICYQIPSLCRAGMGLIISPLIALMNDQVAALRQLGINAGALHSELEPQEATTIRQDMLSGSLDMLYISPERLLSDEMLRFLKKIPLSLIAIDEAHCVSVWGHDFRPEYRLMTNLSKEFPGVPRIALTATADPTTKQDIIVSLGMPDVQILQASFHRTNLFIRAIPKEGETKQLLTILQKHSEEACIIYCGSRNKAERIAAMLVDRGFTALAYHAGLSALEKRTVLLRFRSGEPVIIVATIAFGMGIDRPDVRLVVHLDMPKGPEHYYQQIGRAGRDGDPAETVLLYGGEDIVKARYWLEQSNSNEEQKRIARSRLNTMIAFAETTDCRTQILLRCFGEELQEPCGHCDNCKYPVSLFNGTVAAQKVLSAVYRTGQRFGAIHIINVLRGKKSDHIDNYQHDQLPVFGIGKDKPNQFWRAVIRQLMAKDALRQGAEHSNLFLNQDKALPLLKGNEQLYLREDIVQVRSEKTHAYPQQIELSQEQQHIFDQLKLWRLSEAREQEVPPYIIFHDAVLREIAITCPQNIEALKNVKGIGDSKIERYGQILLEYIHR